ncbi:hypothetical protein G7Y89_g757 [Cudoniella acicularis]|uniref:Uncharacterized protein n=1 Tax=Cudoniella acicularis TaxID=354080 RepID=A0A8H4RXL5_9HELO|nr:hypothetical protein G7Y89_g757 [Cudoniella acicularis]
MPSRFVSSGSNCCTSRGPPSPDGEPPRPAASPRKIPHIISNDATSPCSSAAVAKLQPIFEDDNAPDTEIVHVKHNSTYKLRTLLLGDNEDQSDTEDECVQIRVKKSSSTLNAVRQKLRKHLSRDSALSKRRSKSSVGTSEEEIERRAELRRIRHKRIQEELSNEAIYDDDAKTLSSIVDADSSMGMTSRSSWVPGETLSLPRLLTPSLPYPVLPVQEASEQNVDLKKKGTSTIEKSPSQTSRTSNIPEAEGTGQPLTRSSGTIVRRHSSPVLVETKIDTIRLTVPKPTRKRDSIPSIPSAPVLEPKRLPSISEPRKSSWRLSFTSSKRGEVLRKLSQEHTEPGSAILDSLGVNPPPLKRWLYGQGLRSSSNAIESSEDNTNLDTLASHSQTCTPGQDFGGVDGGVEEDVSSIHLHEMGISHLLASKALQSSSSSPQLSSWNSHHRVASSISDVSKAIQGERARYLRHTSDSVPLSEKIPQSWGKVLEDGTSSFYPSSSTSIQPSPESSRFNLASLLSSSKTKLSNTEVKESEIAQIGTGLATVMTASDCSPTRLAALTRQPRRPTCDDSSILVSETESFREREAELSVVKTRFASSEARRSPSTPVSSKFREEFDLEDQPPETAVNRKPSAFARLAKLAIRSYDGPTMEEILNVPMPDFAPDELRKNKNDSDVMGGAWGTSKKNDRKESSVSDELKTKSVLGGFRRKKNKKTGGKEGISAAEQYQKRFQERVAVKKLVMDSWEEEMAATAAKAKAKSKNIVKKNKPTGPDRRYPAAWARFPSHTRGERSTSAGPPDQIQAIDFAVKSSENGNPIWYHNERKNHLYHHDNDDHPSHADDARKKGLKEKLERAIKEEINEYKNSGEAPVVEDTFGRRSSYHMNLKMDFPELEILPIEIMTAAQIDQEVGEEMAEKARKQDLADTDRGTVDGGVDFDMDGEQSPLKISEVSIADPKFYEDCIVDSDIEEMLPKSDKRQKYRTWSGKDWDGYRYDCSRRNRNISRGSMVLRKSTDDYHTELQIMEKLEREKVLKAAEEAWGRKK